MQRIELKNLLPSGTVEDRSRSNALEEVTVTALGAGERPSVEGVAGAARGILLGSTKDVSEQMSALASQIGGLNSTQQTQVGATKDNTQALTQNTSAKSGPSAASAVGSVASSILGGGWALSPILSGLIGLFGGSSSQSSAPAPSPFQLPTPVQYDAGVSGRSPGQALPVSYSAGGQPRPQMVSVTPQVNVQVNAMDSRSFLDHSDDIARAIKQALLTSNALSDVITDL